MLRRADVVVADRLVKRKLVEQASAAAERLWLEDFPGPNDLRHTAVCRLLVERAKQGKRVVRLKAGDPFMFGRGAEEAEALVEAGVPLEVVPGVTSAVAVPAYAGIPLTDRRLASAVAMVTGHEDPACGPSDIDWAALARITTLVVLMGMRNLEAIVRRLVAKPGPPEYIWSRRPTPAGTSPSAPGFRGVDGWNHPG